MPPNPLTHKNSNHLCILLILASEWKRRNSQSGKKSISFQDRLAFRSEVHHSFFSSVAWSTLVNPFGSQFLIYKLEKMPIFWYYNLNCSIQRASGCQCWVHTRHSIKLFIITVISTPTSQKPVKYLTVPIHFLIHIYKRQILWDQMWTSFFSGPVFPNC